MTFGSCSSSWKKPAPAIGTDKVLGIPHFLPSSVCPACTDSTFMALILYFCSWKTCFFAGKYRITSLSETCRAIKSIFSWKTAALDHPFINVPWSTLRPVTVLLPSLIPAGPTCWTSQCHQCQVPRNWCCRTVEESTSGYSLDNVNLGKVAAFQKARASLTKEMVME